MSPSGRLAVLVAAVALVVLAFVGLRPSDDPEPIAATQATVTSSAPPAPAVTDTATTTGTPSATTPVPTETATTPARPEPPTLLVRDGKAIGGVKDLEFTSGEEIAFRVSSDVADEIHVHGYDVRKDVEAGGTVAFRFAAKLEGVFEVELESAGIELASLKVSPS